MFRLSPRRSHRSQGFKVKHALQLFLLVCVSIWLLYQVRHSREKKAEFEEAARVAKETIKLGRKDLLPRIITDVTHKEDDSKIIDQPKPQETTNTETTTTAHDQEDHRVIQRETDRKWDSLYAKQHMEDRKEDARGKEDEETEENKDEEESKDHDNAETENEENKETEDTQETTNEGKESGEENEGEESKEESGESGEAESDDKGTDENEGKNDGIDAHDEAAREMHYNADDASNAVAHESVNSTAINEHGEIENSDSGENKAHEFVSWSNTNSTEAYIHQEERVRDMTETETDDNIDGVEGNNSTTMDEERNVTELDTSHPFSTIAKDINELQRRSNDSFLHNSTIILPKSTLTYKPNSSASGQVLNSRASYLAAKSSGKFRSTMFRRHARMGAKKREGTQGGGLASNNSAGAGQEKDESSSNGDDVQKLKEEVDYLSVIRKKDETPNEDNKLKEVVDYSSVSRKKDESSDENTRFYNTDSSHSQEDTSTANNGTSDSSLDTSILQEEKDARTDLETLPDSLTAGGNRGEASAAELDMFFLVLLMAKG